MTASPALCQWHSRICDGEAMIAGRVACLGIGKALLTLWQSLAHTEQLPAQDAPADRGGHSLPAGDCVRMDPSAPQRPALVWLCHASHPEGRGDSDPHE